MFHVEIRDRGEAVLVETSTGKVVATGRLVADTLRCPEHGQVNTQVRFVGSPAAERL